MQEAPLRKVPQLRWRWAEDFQRHTQQVGACHATAADAWVVATLPRAVHEKGAQSDASPVPLRQVDLFPEAKQRITGPELSLEEVHDFVDRLALKHVNPLQLSLQPLQESIHT